MLEGCVSGGTCCTSSLEQKAVQQKVIQGLAQHSPKWTTLKSSVHCCTGLVQGILVPKVEKQYGTSSMFSLPPITVVQ